MWCVITALSYQSSSAPLPLPTNGDEDASLMLRLPAGVRGTPSLLNGDGDGDDDDKDKNKDMASEEDAGLAEDEGLIIRWGSYFSSCNVFFHTIDTNLKAKLWCIIMSYIIYFIFICIVES
jgi:hypothetical protein